MIGRPFCPNRALISTLILLIVSSFFYGGCSVKDESESLSSDSTAPRQMGAESPELLIERMKAASKNEDVLEMAACLSPNTRTAMAMGMYFAATMMVAFSSMGLEMGEAMAESFSADDSQDFKENDEKARAEIAKLHENYNALVSKYGLPKLPINGAVEPDMPEQEAEQLFSSIDQGAFLVDVMKFFESIPGEESTPSAEDSSHFKKLEGPLENLIISGDTANGKVGDEDLRFLRIDGRWYVEEADEEK